MKWTCVFGVCLTLAGLSSSARASQCLGPEASAALTSCPAEAKKVRAGARSSQHEVAAGSEEGS